MGYIIYTVYFILLLFIFLYSLVAFYLTVIYLLSKKKGKKQSSLTVLLENNYPSVTVQLPVYNELYVIEQLIDRVCQFDYPKEKLEIQVLDDSDDETVLIIANKVAEWQTKGVNIEYIRRDNRKGFKAGALKEGLKQAKGELIAIFDADFLPDTDFLKNTTFYFTKNDKIGVVQTRWGHTNRSHSLVTKMQAFALDAHFTVEQVGRNKAKHFINFNGTAGIWRKTCIEDAGGWSSDTLTEDLDLSYRAQLKGWIFKYVEKIIVPAELPPEINALKQQQFRWSKGAAECSKKNLGSVLKNPNLTWQTKITALFHLLNSSLYIAVAGLILLSVPLLLYSQENPQFSTYYKYFGVFIISTLLLGTMYFTGFKSKTKNAFSEFFRFLIFYPVFLSLMIGMTTYNVIGVIEGWLGVKSPFVRTPKFNIKHPDENWSVRKYAKATLSPLLIIDFFIILYALYGLILSYRLENYSMMIFLLMVVSGFSYTLILSVKNGLVTKE